MLPWIRPRRAALCPCDLPGEGSSLREHRLAGSIQRPGSQVSSNLQLQLTRFIGREQDVVHLRRLLARGAARMVTLTGLGGTGKICLALEAAQGLASSTSQETPSFDGVWWVELALLGEEVLVPRGVAAPKLSTLPPSRSPRRSAVRQGVHPQRQNRRLRHMKSASRQPTTL